MCFTYSQSYQELWLNVRLMIQPGLGTKLASASILASRNHVFTLLDTASTLCHFQSLAWSRVVLGLLTDEAEAVGPPHTGPFFMRRVAFRHDVSRRDFDNMAFCDMFCTPQ